MRLYISRKFKKDPDDTLLSFSNTVYQKMTDDVKYALYKPMVDDIKVKNAINYTIRFKPKSETVWQNGLFNHKGTYTFTQLQSDTVYEFEVCALGPNGLIGEHATTMPIYVS